MRKTLGRMPSPAMAVAFVALLAALTGTAVALPGSNVVTSGDITNGAVKTQDIRNSTVRGRDVRNNTLTGSDVNEGSLGTVPSANFANGATAARTATQSVLAGTALNLARQSIGGLAGANDDGEVVLANVAGFRFSVFCDLDNVDTESLDEAEIQIENVSAGDDALFDSDDNSDSNFDQGDVEYITSDNGDPDFEHASYSVTNGSSVVHGLAAAGSDDSNSGAFPTDCVGSVTTQGS